jgi:cytochrome c oxidase subunit 5a
MSFVRAVSRVNCAGLRVPASRVWTAQRAFSVSAARCSDAHQEETFEEFTARYAAWGSVEGGAVQAQ